MRRAAAGTLLSIAMAAACTAPRSQAPQTAGIEIDVISDVEARGRLVVMWRTPEEQAAVARGQLEMSVVRAMLERSEPKDDVDFARTKRVHVTIGGAPANAVPIAVLDIDHTFWETFLGGGHGLMGTAAPGAKEIRLAPNPKRPPPPSPPPERCAGERYRLVTIDAPEVAPAPSPRRFCAWLPKSFTSSPARRYPIVFLFPGLMSNEMAYLTGDNHLGIRIDRMDREAVLVGVDTSAPIGSTYLDGPWEKLVTDRALPEIERELHALSRRSGRALVGQSTGGFNVLSLGMRRSDLFAAIGASSPDPPDFEVWMFGPDMRHAKPWVHHWLRVEAAVGGAGQMPSWAQSFSHGAWPFDPTTGTRNDAVFAEWVKHTPHGFLSDPAALARIKSDLQGRIFVTVGRADEFDLFAPAERFVEELKRNDLEPTFVPVEGGHGNQNPRLETALRFVLDHLDRAE